MPTLNFAEVGTRKGIALSGIGKLLSGQINFGIQA
jgi:hypothetical protein